MQDNAAYLTFKDWKWLTALPLEMDEIDGDKELVCSLDRIDSNGHYEKDNLQVVCKFANRWKGDSDNDEFIRLINMLSKR